jgi:hypothetical protein
MSTSMKTISTKWESSSLDLVLDHDDNGDNKDNKKLDESVELDVDDNNNSNNNDHSKYVWLYAFYHSVAVCIGTGILGTYRYR